MTTVTLNGNPMPTNGELPQPGELAPEFELTGSDLQIHRLSDYANRKIVLNIVPSLDTPTCAASARRFNEAFAQRKDAVVLVISADLPFAQERFCSTEGLKNVISLSMMQDRQFAKDYGVLLTDGPLAGLAARAVVIIDEAGTVMYTQLVEEIADEPDYDAVLEALQH
ncbi:thiol peroxidase [Thiolapillus brandeum]|uniref:Thiol peroxidase n=1 Tax=Thiolapillus brandeum TaxID=1076588 RepID=A0A7U6GHQ8_9GAMM|nr:thiol peroxidase [Thiolapillus brandeum]BAO43827.1 thiol peroxidase atypical 2-Cys peroxiredoxin [Thiolapillus brandeum]